MRKITLLFLMLFVCSLGYSQYTIDDTDTTPFEDISATGTAMGLSDDGEGNAVIPFAFDFDGTVSSDVRIGNNGALLFGVTTGDVFAGNAVLAGQTPRIAPFWDDLDTESGDVYYVLSFNGKIDHISAVQVTLMRVLFNLLCTKDLMKLYSFMRM